MQAKRAYRDRDRAQVAVLDALVDRHEEGMTVFELRSRTDLDIDSIESALADLKGEGLIQVEKQGSRTLIRPDDRVVPDPDDQAADDETWLDRLLDRLPF